MLFDAVLAIVWKALDRHGFSEADRKDLAQDVAIAAFRRHLSYRAERGSPGQWLSGIVRREVKRFLRVQNRQPWFAAGDELPDTPDGTATPEDEVSRRDLAEHVFAMLPPAERRVVILVEIDHLTFREVAEREHISPSTAYERHQRGMAALRDAAARSKEQGQHAAFPLSLALAAMFGAGGGSEPPPEFVEQAWQRAVMELGLGDPPRSSRFPIEPSPADDAVPPSGPRRAWPFPTPPKLGAIGAFGLSCVVGGLMLGRCSAERAHAESAPVALAPAPQQVAAGAPTVERGPEPPSVEAMPATASDPEVDQPFTGPPQDDSRDDGPTLLRRGRNALVARNYRAARDAFAEHAWRFPHGPGVSERDQLWSEACRRLRAARDESAATDARCAGRR
jgi:RNA polymerase sigma factor (sigma-70 family)